MCTKKKTTFVFPNLTVFAFIKHMDAKGKRIIVNALTFGRVPFVVLFMVLAIVHA